MKDLGRSFTVTLIIELKSTHTDTGVHLHLANIEQISSNMLYCKPAAIENTYQ